MASIGVDVYLRGNAKGGGGQTDRAKQTLSAGQSAHVNKIAKKTSIKYSAISSFITSGNVKPGMMLIPGMSKVMAAAQAVNKVAQFGIGIYQAHSGEDMLAANMSATWKAYTTFGGSLIKAGFDNLLYNRPRVRRQNNMLEYGRNLYSRNIDNEKNSFG